VWQCHIENYQNEYINSTNCCSIQCTLVCDRDAPFTGDRAHLNPNQFLPQRPRNWTHAVFSCRNVDILALVTYSIYRTDDCSCTCTKSVIDANIAEKKIQECLPAPNSSTIRPDSEAALTSFMVTGRSETTKFSGR